MRRKLADLPLPSRAVEPAWNRGGKRLRLVVSWGIALSFSFPLLMLLSGSFRKPGTPPPRDLELIPRNAGFESYRTAFELSPLMTGLLRSLLLATIFTVVAVASASMAGFAIANMRRRRVAIGIVLALFIAPTALTFLTRFLMWDALGMARSDVPLIAPALLGGTPFAVLLYALAFSRIPKDLLDAARLELPSELGVFRRIAMPLVKGTTLAVGMLAFVQSWSAFLDPLLHLSRKEDLTAPFALRFLHALPSLQQPILLAGAVLVALPPMIAFAIAQKALFAQGETSR